MLPLFCGNVDGSADIIYKEVSIRARVVKIITGGTGIALLTPFAKIKNIPGPAGFGDNANTMYRRISENIDR